MISKSLAISILTIILIIECKAVPRTKCKGKVEIQYEKTSRKARRDGLEADRNLKAVSIEFLNNFNHKIKGYINGELLFDELVVTNDVTGLTDKYFGYNYSRDDDLPLINLIIEDYDDCFELEVLNKYKLIYIFLSEKGEFTIRYSNTIYDIE